MKQFPKALILSVLAALVFLPRLGETCGPFFNPAVFVRPHGPDEPLSDFARGKIGVVLPEWRTAFRIVAYRYLEAKPLSAAEQQSLLENYDADRRVEPPEPTKSTVKGWDDTRSQYSPPPPPDTPQEFKPAASLFYNIPNCLGPAFITAAADLAMTAPAALAPPARNCKNGFAVRMPCSVTVAEERTSLPNFRRRPIRCCAPTAPIRLPLRISTRAERRIMKPPCRISGHRRGQVFALAHPRSLSCGADFDSGGERHRRGGQDP